MILRLTLAVAVMFAAAACSTHEEGPRNTSATTSPSSPLSATDDVPSPATRTIALPGSGVGPIAVGDEGGISAPYGEPNWNAVAYAAPGATQARVVARSQWQSGLINWSAVAGDWVGYVDQSAVQGDDARKVGWAIWAVNVATGDRVALARSPKAMPWVPRVSAGSGVFTWSTATPDLFADTWIWHPGDARPTKLLSNAQIGPGSEIPLKDRLIYTGPRVGTPRPASGDTFNPGGDCWSVSYDGSSAPQPLTHDGSVMSCTVMGEAVAYATHFDPARDSSDEPELDDPYAISVQPFDGSQPRRVEEGYTSGYPVSGSTFVSWNTAAGRVLLTAHGQSDPDPTSGAALRTAARGQLLAYGGSDQRSIEVITVAD